MNMFGHQDVAGNHKAVAPTYSLELTLEDAVRCRVVQQRQPPITTEGEKVKYAAVVIADKPLGHDGSIVAGIGLVEFVAAHPSLERSEGWGTPVCGRLKGGPPAVAMQVIVGDHDAMIAAAVQCDVDGIAKGSHWARVIHFWAYTDSGRWVDAGI